MDLKALAGKPFLKTYVLWSAVALAAFAAIGFFILPPIVKAVLVKQLSEKLHRPVAIRTIRIDPFALSVRVEGFSMKDRGGSGPFLSFEELYLNLQAASLVRGGPVLREILLRSPSVSVVRNEDSTYNFSDILDAFASKPSEGGKPLRYSLNNIRIVGGSVDFDDRLKHTRHVVRDLSIAIPFLSNLAYAADVYVRPAFEANINGTIVALAGNATLKNLSITDGKDVPVLRLPSLSVGIGSLEPLAKRAKLDNVVITSPDVSLVREKTGVLNVVSLLPDSESTAEAEKSKEDGKANLRLRRRGEKEYPEYLKRAYREEKFPKPRNIIGMVKDIPVLEMEKLIYTHLQVTDDDLRLLAQRRSRAVKDFLIASKQVAPERVFLVEPKALAPEKKEKQRDSRVVFVLK